MARAVCFIHELRHSDDAVLSLNPVAIVDDICKCILFNESFRILIQISLKVVPKGPFNDKSALV